MPPAVNSLLSAPSISQSVCWDVEPPTESENGSASSHLAGGRSGEKTVGVCSAVVPGMSVASCTNRAHQRELRTCWDVDDLAEGGFEVSTATSVDTTSTVELRWRGTKRNPIRAAHPRAVLHLLSTPWKPWNSTRIV